MNIKCKHCTMEIPSESKTCPCCGKSIQKTKWTMTAKVMLSLVIISLAIAIMINQVSSGRQHMPEEPVSVISVSAENLYHDYEANEISADMKYKNKTVQITGTIRIIGKSGDSPYINLATGNFTHQVIVFFPKGTYDTLLASYSQGSRIEVTGICKGKLLGMVTISL